MLWIAIVGGVVLLLGIIVWSVNNRLVQADNQVDEALSLIDVQLKKRLELIPNLVEAVAGSHYIILKIRDRFVENLIVFLNLLFPTTFQ